MIDMSLKVCIGCGTVYLPADVCPHCGSAVFRFDWEEEPKPKGAAKAAADK